MAVVLFLFFLLQASGTKGWIPYALLLQAGCRPNFSYLPVFVWQLLYTWVSEVLLAVWLMAPTAVYLLLKWLFWPGFSVAVNLNLRLCPHQQTNISHSPTPLQNSHHSSHLQSLLHHHQLGPLPSVSFDIITVSTGFSLSLSLLSSFGPLAICLTPVL